jgi:prohibitin 1
MGSVSKEAVSVDGFEIKVSTVAVWLFAIVAVIFGISTIFKAFVSIPAGNRGVVMAFGKVQDAVLSEGLHIIMPFRDSVQIMSVQILRTDLNMTAASGDMQDVNSSVVINWSIDPGSVNKIYQSVGDEDLIASKIIAPAVLESFKAATAKRHADQILQNREDLRAEFDSALKDKLSKYPITIVATSITDIEFSAEYKKAIEEKQVAEQDAQKAIYVAEQAKNDAQAKINEAYGDAQANKLKSLTITPKIIAMAWISKWSGVLPTVVLGSKSMPMINLSGLSDTSAKTEADSDDSTATAQDNSK